MSILPAWSPFFNSSARMRGRVYLTGDRVERLDPKEGELVRAHVYGKQCYLVTIRRDGQRAEAECACPQFGEGVYCKHIWATLLSVQQHDGPGASSSELARLHVRAPKARKRAGAGRSPIRESEPEWIGRLSLLRPATAEISEQSPASSPDEGGISGLPAQQQICYMVLPEASERSQSLVVEVRQRTPTAAGWSRSKPLRLDPNTIATLAAASDRELCALLLGGSSGRHDAVATRGDTAIRLPSGAWRNLLQRMIATQRCFVGAGENEDAGELPLRWAGDQPWVLWMVGRLVTEGVFHGEGDGNSDTFGVGNGTAASGCTADQSGEGGDGTCPSTAHTPFERPDAERVEDKAADDTEANKDSPHSNPPWEHLLVSVELRRNGQTLAIERPRMVLGGLDGAVIWDDKAAPFDDRDALRWGSHFRDEHRRRDEPRPIRVPKADVERFLDRLYMLPQIPEIDLPEGIGRVPVHLDPVPHLELFSPGSSEAKRLLPASARNQLVARAWFAYDTQRVTPGQAGRFLTISSSASRTDIEQPGEMPEQLSESIPSQEIREYTDISSTPDAESDPASESSGTDSAEGSASESYAADEESSSVLPYEGLLIQRNHRSERDALAELATLGFRALTSAGPDTLVLPARQMPEAVASLLGRGWNVLADRQPVHRPAAPRLGVTTGADWFELRGSVQYERADGSTQDVSLPRILAAAREGENMIQLDDGSQGLVPEQWLEQHGLLTGMGQLKNDHLRFATAQAALLDALLGEQPDIDVDEPFRRLRERLQQFQGVVPLDSAPQFQGSLRPYQREGLGWMAMLRWFAMGGILADDMGLGKTIQVLAMLQQRSPASVGSAEQSEGDAEERDLQDHESESFDASYAPAPRPSLVVAPRSVVFNWIDEAQKFTGDLRVMAYAGAERQALRDVFQKHDLIVTSYGLLRRDIEELRQFEFDYVILDEAQAIKNPASQAAKAARLLRGDHRLALTGTPVENHLGDLWSIFEFLNPGMLGASSRFHELLRLATQGSANNGGNGSTVGTTGEKQTLEQIGRALRPFILRRTKKQVLADLPDKTEQTIACEMEPAQRQIYDELRNYYRHHLLTQLDRLSPSQAGSVSAVGGKAGFMVLEALLRLRQAACHPALINDDYAETSSAKLDVLMDLLEDVCAEGSKALVFSQFTSMLALVRHRFEQQGVRYCYLDGQTRNRREVVHRFQNDPLVDAFLISLKSGGFGLNLTAAEYVFILDPWWNPAVEQQAIDRTHRIGQTQRVFAYRLICRDTVEQRIIDLQKQKKQIADAVVGGEQQVLTSLTRDDLERLLS